tara:strand:+ start:347 stop:538 length:192 start_codon:yes stop_codon:yes gene_type:complete
MSSTTIRKASAKAARRLGCHHVRQQELPANDDTARRFIKIKNNWLCSVVRRSDDLRIKEQKYG